MSRSLIKEFCIDVLAAILLVAIVAGCLEVWIAHKERQMEARWNIAQLEAGIESLSLQLLDAHWALENLDRQVLHIETDLTPREVIWSLADAMAENGCEVTFH